LFLLAPAPSASGAVSVPCARLFRHIAMGYFAAFERRIALDPRKIIARAAFE
jgi:hypothetical protein